jgi:hypothetical protein
LILTDARQEYGQRVFGGHGRVLTLAAGQAITAITLNLISAGVVSGVVRDPSGEPIERRTIPLHHILSLSRISELRQLALQHPRLLDGHDAVPVLSLSSVRLVHSIRRTTGGRALCLL